MITNNKAAKETKEPTRMDYLRALDKARDRAKPPADSRQVKRAKERAAAKAARRGSKLRPSR